MKNVLRRLRRIAERGVTDRATCSVGARSERGRETERRGRERKEKRERDTQDGGSATSPLRNGDYFDYDQQQFSK